MLNLHVKIESGRLALNEAMHVKNYADWNSSIALVSPFVLFMFTIHRVFLRSSTSDGVVPCLFV